MLDGQIVNALITEIENQLTIYGLANFRVTRSNQPTNQHAGATLGKSKYVVLVTPISNPKIGWGRKYNDDETVTITHNQAKTYQIDALVDFDPSDLNDIPASDLCSIVSDMIQQPDAIRNLRDSGVRVENCGDVRPTFSVNNEDRFESTPSFDLTVTYNSQYTKSAPDIDGVNHTLEGV